jgi:ABC-type Co2+ transport system permease subunit
MSPKTHSHRRFNDELRTSKLAVASVAMLLLNVFQAITLRSLDMLIVSAVAFLLALLGAFLGYKARRAIRRYQGVLQGDAAAQIGYWINLAVAFAALLYFLWNLFLAMYSGRIL